MGLKPGSFGALYAALKRRSSTVPRGFVMVASASGASLARLRSISCAACGATEVVAFPSVLVVSGKTSTGAEARFLLGLYAALKRRSSTVLQVAIRPRWRAGS
jgi:hypothetical protein